MITYTVRRIAGGAVLLFAVITVVFVLLRVAPGDPVRATLGEFATEAEIERQREALGMNRPITEQYFSFLRQIAGGDLGESYRMGQSVSSAIGGRLAATIELALAASLFAMIFGVALGLTAALRRGTWVDRVASAVGLVGISVPTFWLGLMFILYFGSVVDWFPTGARLPSHISSDGPTGLHVLDGLLTADVGLLKAALRHLVLPAVTLGAGMAGIVVRITRSSLLEVLGEDYIRTARSKGSRPARIAVRHALRASLLPIVTVFGLEVAGLLSGSVIVETIYSWPGLGSLAITAVTSRDYALVQGCAVVFAVVFVLANLVVDVSYGILDPRTRHGRSSG